MKDQHITSQFKKMRTYGIAIFVVLLLFHLAALSAVYWLERQEVRSDLEDASRDAATRDIDSDELQSLSERDGIIRLRRDNDEKGEGFSEREIGGRDYYIYESPDQPFITARYEGDIQQEIVKIAAVLAALYIGECLALLSWWFYLRDEINQIFTVK